MSAAENNKPAAEPKDGAAHITERIDQLKSKIDWFYGDEFSLDEAIQHYEDALKLSREVERDLEQMKNKVTVLAKDFSRE